MNKTIAAILISCLMLAGGLAHAGYKGKCGHGYSADKKLEWMTKKLDLTTDQQNSIRAILEEKKTKIDELMKQKSALKKESREKIHAVLTDKQQSKHDKLMKKHKKKGKWHKKHHKKKKRE